MLIGMAIMESTALTPYGLYSLCAIGFNQEVRSKKTKDENRF